MRNNEFISDVLPFFSLSPTQSPVLPSLPAAALPLAAGKWTKAPLNRPMHSVKARGLDLSWRGETQFISAPDQLPAKRTSHPISRRLQHKKQEWGGGGGVCWVGGVVLRERGLWAGKSWWILDWFLNFSSLRRGGGEMRQRGKTNIKYVNANTSVCTHTRTHTQGCFKWPLDLLIIYLLVGLFIMPTC